MKFGKNKSPREQDEGDEKPPGKSSSPARNATRNHPNGNHASPRLIDMVEQETGMKKPATKPPAKKMPADIPRDGLNDAKSREVQARKAALKMAPVLPTNVDRKAAPKRNPLVPTANDEKSREVQARKALLAQAGNESIKPRRQFGIPEGSTSSCSAPKPPSRRTSEDLHVLSKRREINSSSHSTNTWKLAPATGIASRRGSKDNVPSASSHSSGSASTAVTQNVSSRFLSNRLHAVSLVLEEDDGGEFVAETTADANAKRNTLPATVKKLHPAAPRRHSMTENCFTHKAATLSNGTTHQNVARERRATISSYGTAIPSAEDDEVLLQTKSNVGAHSVQVARRDSMTKDGNDEEADAVQQHLASLAASHNHAPSALFLAEDGVEGGHISGLTMLDDDVDLDDNDEFANAEGSEGVIGRVFPDTTPAANPGSPAIDGTNANGNGISGMNTGVGVPVVSTATPGAFAVEGINARSGDGHSESLVDEDDFNVEYGSSGVMLAQPGGNGQFHDPTFTDPNSALYLDPELANLPNEEPASALDAELHEVVVLDGRVLVDDYEQGWTSKHRRRLQCTLACLILGVVASVIAGVSQLEKNKTQWQDSLPAIEGWVQIGLNLTGPTDDDRSKFGYDISIDGSSQRIAVGVPGKDKSANELLVGEVHIMDWNGSQFLPKGLILGPGPGGQAGSAVAMSKDGKRVAVASPFYTQLGGSVAVYEERQDEWVAVGQTLIGGASDLGVERFGSSVALNDAGDILAIGSSLGHSALGSNTGYVKIFQLQTYSNENLQDQWVQIGSTIFGENDGDMFGWSLAISSSGERIAAGSIGSAGDGNAEFAGQVRVFDYVRESGDWSLSGSSLSGIAAFDTFGASCSLSSKGDVLAVGAIGHSEAQVGVDVGHVRVFQSVATDKGLSWQPLGQTLVGEDAFDSFGYSVALSEDGKVLAAGSPRNDKFGENSGHVQVFELDEKGKTWKRRGSNIGGSYKGRDSFGWSIALSANGSIVAGGAPFSSYDGRLNDVGTVRVYEVDSD